MNRNPWFLFLASLGAELPDIDLILGGHRTWSHSIFFPLLFLLLIFSLPDSVTERISKWDERRFYFGLFGILWVTHLMYDTTYGPLAYFYPIDHRLYNVQEGIIFVLNSALVGIGGFFIEITPIDPKTGKNIFFVNWTAEERVNLFGSSTLKYPVIDFMIHATLFFYWVWTVLVPAISYKFSQSTNGHIQAFNGRVAKLVSHIRLPQIDRERSVSILLISIALCGFFAGPYYGEKWSFKEQSSISFNVMSDQLQLFGSIEFNIPANGEMSSIIFFPKSVINYTVAWGFIDPSSHSSLQRYLKNLTADIAFENISYSEIVSQHRERINQTAITNNWTITEVLNNNVAYQVSVTDNDADTQLILAFALHSWNITKFFQRTVLVETIFTLVRTDAFQKGMAVTIAAVALLFAVNLNKWMKRRKIT